MRRDSELRQLAGAVSIAVNDPKKIEKIGSQRRRESHPRESGFSGRRWWPEGYGDG